MVANFNQNAKEMSVKLQFVTTVATILMVGLTTVGVNLAIISAMGEANDVRFAQIDARFAQVDARFEQVDARFEQVDARFEQVDARFERMDRRMDQMEARIASLERRVDDGFREMGAAIARLEGLMQGILGASQAASEGPAPQQDSPT